MKIETIKSDSTTIEFYDDCICNDNINCILSIIENVIANSLNK